MKRLFIVLVSLGFLSSGFAQRAWKGFTDPEANFKVLFPGVPQIQTGAERNLHVFTVRAEAEAYGLSYSDYSPGSDWEKVVDAERDSLVGPLGGKVLSEKRVSLDGNPGKWVKFSGKDWSGQLELYFVGQRLYFLQAIAAPGSERPQNFAKFLNSFRLLSKSKAK